MAQTAYEALRDNQRQLDMDGVEVGVSRQALDEVLNAYDARLDLTQAQIAYILNAVPGGGSDRKTRTVQAGDVTGAGVLELRAKLEAKLR